MVRKGNFKSLFKFQKMSCPEVLPEKHIPVRPVPVFCLLKQLCVIFAAFIRGLLQWGHLFYACLFNRCCQTDEDVCVKEDDMFACAFFFCLFFLL